MKQPNISFVLKMTKDFLDGKMADYEYRLDFPYEVEQRYAKMKKENQILTEIIWECLVEPTLELYNDVSDDEFREKIAQEYDYIQDVRRGKVDFL